MRPIPKTFIQRLKYVGPGVIVAGSVIGSGELILTSLLGALAGFTFFWWILLSIGSKSIIQAELARYVIVKKRTFLEIFSEIPGLAIQIRQKKTSWVVWFLFLGVIPGVAGGGGIVGSAAQAGHMLLPLISENLWVIIICLLTWLILYWGSYKSLEKVLLLMVITFSVITLIISIVMQTTEYQVNIDQILHGLSFDFKLEYLALAIAVYGYTGINFGEIMAYTYWCLEKGYAKEAGNKNEGIKSWIKVMQTDVWTTLLLMTIGTLPFFFLGAGVLNQLPAEITSELTFDDIIPRLIYMFTEVMGDWAKWIFLIGAFFVLFSTVLSGTAGFTRTIPDYLITTGLVEEKETSRKSLLKKVALAVPLASALIYFFYPHPVNLLLIAGIWAALSLPLVNAVAIYLANQLDPSLQPKKSTKMFLWTTLILQIFLALLIVFNQAIGF